MNISPAEIGTDPENVRVVESIPKRLATMLGVNTTTFDARTAIGVAG
jgi:hypothetical protein